MPPKARAPVAANPEPEAAPALTAALSLQFPRITDQDHELHALLSLQALAASEQDENSRPPVELMLVLDRSGSMAGAPLTLVKRAAEFVVDHLGDGDKLGLVTFDSGVDTVFSLQPVGNAAQRKLLNNKIGAIHNGGATNLSGGLLAAMKEFDFQKKVGRNEKAPIRSLFLLTDGEANSGITDSKQLVKAAQGISKNLSICTFGFGGSHDSNFLTAISDAFKGSYAFIESNDQVAANFADPLASLVTMVASSISVTLDKVFKAGDTTFDVTVASETGLTVNSTNQNKLKLTLPDMYAEQSRDVLLVLQGGSKPEESVVGGGGAASSSAAAPKPPMKKGANKPLVPGTTLKASVEVDYLSVRAGEPKWYSANEKAQAPVVVAEAGSGKLPAKVGDFCQYKSTTYKKWIDARVTKVQGVGKGKQVELDVKADVFHNPNDGQLIRAPAHLTAHMIESEDPNVAMARIKIHAADAIEEAQSFANAGQLESARDHLKDVMDYIRGVLITGSTGKKKVDNKEIVDIATGLIAELQECKDGLKNKESYQSYGKHIFGEYKGSYKSGMKTSKSKSAMKSSRKQMMYSKASAVYSSVVPPFKKRPSDGGAGGPSAKKTKF